MAPNSPLPQGLAKECKKAEKIMRSFVEPSRNGLDGVIPRHVMAQAKGFAIFSVVKAGFFFSARAGSGIVIARLPDGNFSAPSAIGTAGMGFGGQLGAEITDFLIVLNSDAAVRSFMAAGSLTLGGNLSVAVGPLGRNGELAGAVNTKGKVAAMYSYSKTKGLFGGISVEGSVILERQDANCIAYEDDTVSAKKLLTGVVPPPKWAGGLIDTLEKSVGGIKGWIAEEPRPSLESGYSFSGSGTGKVPGQQKRPSFATRTLSGSSDAIKKVMSTPIAGRPGRSSSTASNPANAYLTRPRESLGSTSREVDPDPRGSSRQNSIDEQSPFGSSDLSPAFHESFSKFELKDDSARKSVRDSSGGRTFNTFFESDFDPAQHYGSSKLSQDHTPPATDAHDDDDPFGIYTDTARFGTRNSSSRDAYNTQGSSGHSRQSSGNYAYESPRASFDTGRTTPPLLESTSFNSYSSESPISYASPKPVGGPLRQLSLKKELQSPLSSGESRAIALYSYSAQQSGDLSFNKGQVITVTRKTGTSDDWWTGRLDGNEGIFPANYVELV